MIEFVLGGVMLMLSLRALVDPWECVCGPWEKKWEWSSCGNGWDW